MLEGLTKNNCKKQIKQTKTFGGKVKVELDLSNYATKADLKNTTDAGTSKFVKNPDLANLNFDFENCTN